MDDNFYDFFGKKKVREELDHFHENWESLIRPFFLFRREMKQTELRKKKKKK